jgi:hypothetical protein
MVDVPALMAIDGQRTHAVLAHEVHRPDRVMEPPGRAGSRTHNYTHNSLDFFGQLPQAVANA